MKRARHMQTTLVAAISCLSLALLWSTAAQASLQLSPSAIKINAFFNGQQVEVHGEIPQGSQAIVEVEGKRIEEELLRKGRHWDIWMSVGEIDIDNAPCLYFALSTDPGSFSAKDSASPFGYAALKKRATFHGDTKGLTHAKIFQEFVELKESEHLYHELPGALKVSPASKGRSTIDGFFHIPSRVAPGDYQVRLLVLDQGKVLRSKTEKVNVRIVGWPAFLYSLARQHGALYGVFAIVIAVVFGFLVGLVFKKKGH